MRISIAVFTGVCLSSAVAAADPPPSLSGWGKARWGMTPAQVIAAEAPRAESAPGKGLSKQFESDGVLAQIPEITLEGERFHADFYFDEKQRLSRIRLQSYEEKNERNNARTFAKLEKVLTEKYGVPTFKDPGKTVSWKLPKTLITLKHSAVRGWDVSNLSVTYEPVTTAEDL